MIIVRSLKEFLQFIEVAKAKGVPYHIVGCQDKKPSIFDFDEKITRFCFRYALCCPLFTVYISSSVEIEKRDSITGLFDENDITLFKKINISNGMIECT